jgi:hypothetical protein
MNTRKLLVSILMLVSILLSACAPVATPLAPTAVPTTAILPTAAPTVVPDQEQTAFSSSRFEIPMTLTYGSDWYSEGEFPDLFTLKIKGTGYAWELGFILATDAQIADPNSSATIPWPDDFVAYLQSNHYFEAGQPISVTVGGVKGIQIDALVKNIGRKRTFLALESTDWLYLDDTEMYRFIMLDGINGQRLFITMNAPPDGFSKANELEQKVLDTVVFTQPTVFSPKTFDLITSVNFGSGWHVEEDLLQDLYLDNGQMPIVFNVVTTAHLVDPVGGNLIPFPDDFMSWIQSNPDFKTGEPTQVTVGGSSGVQIDATPNTNISKKEFGLTWNILTSDGDWRFILLDNVNGEHVLIFMIAPAGKTFSELPELQQEIQHILDSVVFA